MKLRWWLFLSTFLWNQGFESQPKVLAAAAPQLWEMLSSYNPPRYTPNQNADTPPILSAVPPFFNQLRITPKNNEAGETARIWGKENQRCFGFISSIIHLHFYCLELQYYSYILAQIALSAWIDL